MRGEFPKSGENALNPEVSVEAGTGATQEEGRFQCDCTRRTEATFQTKSKGLCSKKRKEILELEGRNLAPLSTYHRYVALLLLLRERKKRHLTHLGTCRL
jgi:hypothetical protein